MYQTLLLDIDGTLLDFEMSQEKALENTFAKYKFPLTKEIRETYNKINHSLWKQYELGQVDRNTVIYTRFGKLFETVGIDGDGIAFEDDYQYLLGSGAYWLDGAEDLVKYLHQKYHLYIVTNGVTDTQRRRLRATGLDQYARDIFISDEIGCQKPQKEYFDICFDRIGAKADRSRCLVIGDTLSSDIKGGNNAGIDTCWYNPKNLPRENGIDITIEVHSFQELYTIL